MQPDIETIRNELEDEYDQELRDIVRGYFEDGESGASTARILGCNTGSLYKYAVRMALDVPRRPRVQMPKPASHAANTSKARRQRDPHISFAGQSLSYAGWSEITGISRETIRKRINRGWPIAEALRIPTQSNSKVR